MNKTVKPILVTALLLGFCGGASTLEAALTPEEKLIQQLESPKASKVTDALLKLEKQYPTSTNALPIMKRLLSDPRPEVRRKAARVLGELHADLDQESIQKISALLKSSSPPEIIDGLKALRGLRAPETIPDILPLLKHSNANVIRDACRTLAVLGNKETIPAIEPLFDHPNSAVKKDAQDAIFALRAKG